MANRVSDKLTKVHDRIYCCRSGSAADTQAVSDMVRRHIEEHALIKGTPPTVKAASHLFREICYKNKDRLMAGVICAGWDAVRGGQVYGIPIGGSCHRQPFSIGGSGSTYVYGLVDRTFREGMGKDECMDFVKETVSHAMARDGSSGGVIRLVVIDKEGVTTHFVPGDALPYHLEGR